MKWLGLSRCQRSRLLGSNLGYVSVLLVLVIQTTALVFTTHVCWSTHVLSFIEPIRQVEPPTTALTTTSMNGVSKYHLVHLPFARRQLLIHDSRVGCSIFLRVAYLDARTKESLCPLGLSVYRNCKPWFCTLRVSEHSSLCCRCHSSSSLEHGALVLG